MNLRKLTLTSLAALCTMTIWCGATFTDVPADSALAEGVEQAQNYGLMNGYSDTVFGYGDSMTRGQFVTVLGRMMGWEFDQESAMPVAEDITDSGFYTAIVTAAQQDVWDMADATFRPNDAITRSEMCEMLVRGLGLKSAAASASKDLPFTDISGDTGYISVAYAIGMTNGTSATTFAPDNTATRAQAATMLVRIYEKLQEPMSTQGFYAISSASQLDLTATDMDTIHFGWSRMTWDGDTALLSTVATGDNDNVFAVPGGYDDVVRALEDKERNLMVFMDTTDDVAGLLSNAQGRTQGVAQIIHELTVSYSAYGANPYTGVTIDFEGLRSGQMADFNAFLTELSAQVKEIDKTLTVCVSPVLQTGTYYDGYDYKTIAGLADEILLMAYNYDATDLSGFETSTYHQTAAPAPIDQVFWGLESLVDALDGQAERIVLGLSYKYIAWQVDENGKLLSPTPVYPALDTITARLAQETTVHGWSDTYQTPYALYETEDGSRYFLWYENQDSMDAKTQVAQLLGVNTVSLWRLGLIL